MTEAVLDIKKWGNSLGVRLPAAVAREAKLHADQRVRICVEDGRITITPVSGMTLEQRLASFDPSRHGAETMQADEEVGAEKWQG
ncbi:MAG: AbrB/MazE/SpoVT family DNA-binding domain-containing protein [Desulfomicrobium apsheronum]|jgi:antitoxin MazE|nr:AbrB/MazE/SpoVT family DNA-binding domain-containing protein [Desulfomicrobium apsheronum]